MGGAHSAVANTTRGMFQPGRTISNAEIIDLLAATRNNGGRTSTVLCVTFDERGNFPGAATPGFEPSSGALGGL